MSAHVPGRRHQLGHKDRPDSPPVSTAGPVGSVVALAPRAVSSSVIVVLVGLAAAASLVVAWLADSAREHDALATLDPSVAAEIVRVRSTSLTTLAQALTWVGSEAVVGVVAVVVLGFLLRRRHLFEAMVLAAALGGSAALTVLLKLAVGRPRPGAVDRLGAVDATWSFPSGHTLNTAVLLVVLAWLFWPRATPSRVALVVSVTALGVGVGASRIYLGYHWMTDVLASVLVATAWLSIVTLLAAPAYRIIERAVGHAAPTRMDG